MKKGNGNMWRIYKLFGFIKDIPKEIKWFFQRGFKGYCDKDVWAIDIWFENTIIPMLEQLQKNKTRVSYRHDRATMEHYFKQYD